MSAPKPVPIQTPSTNLRDHKINKLNKIYETYETYKIYKRTWIRPGAFVWVVCMLAVLIPPWAKLISRSLRAPVSCRGKL